ncbi:SNF2-related protein [Micromonospora soli]|uniref:SNF2-related protein n=1 Tax=Micromonospora sp. NBRC 110009 TaxID=3061627 RepID=UPI002673594E|nr:SNF2-related protein [Micromonospora sp. NBRC 110009]WKT97519.1 SNF2-related protein [Micromonospora sp. NBRC 110009]
MGELVSVERIITAALLENGEISLGPVEQTRLGLPSHSADLALVVDDESLAVAWVAGRRRLHGESLAEYLQDTARVGGLLRLERRGEGPLRLVVSAPGAQLSYPMRLPGAVVAAPGFPAASGAAAARSAASPLRRASTGGRYRLRKREEYAWHGKIGFLKSARKHAVGALKNRGWDPADAVELRLEGERLATLDQFDELLAIDAAHIEHMPHQEAAARTVLTRMGGRGILADEVGLGKTVEAGLVLKELMLRGLAQRILIICPAPLRDQWRDELRDKFDEDFTVVASGQDARAFEQDRIIMTLQLALRNAERFGKRFDLVIVDEAHRLSGAGAKRTREVVGGLVAKAPRALFLSATPVQNNLLELYRLVELLRPGTFDSEYDFARRFVDPHDPRRPVNAVELRKLISSVVVRTTRQQAGVDRVHRMPPQDHGVVLTPPERQLYNLLLHTLRHRMTGPADTMRRRQLALRLTASPQAVSRSALRMAERQPDRQLRQLLTEIGHLAGDIRHTSREQTALEVVQRWLDEHGRVLMFTQHTDTLTGILRLLDGAGISAAPFHGGMTHAARSASVADFRSGRARVLVSTDAGAEGQNLQVSNCVLNYDLPWNPMRVEQRIGRVHRLTQTRDVYIANLFARDTLDEAVYRLLHDKLAMFELLFGQVVTVLGELEGTQDSSMENRVLEALYAKSDASMQSRLNELGNELEQARSRAMTMMTADAGLSDWLAQRQEERRKRAAQPEARELLPQAAKHPRRRQKDLERFVCQFLTAAGASLTQPAEGLTVATLPDDLAESLGGRRELFLAFTNAALDHHPEAQLCVVGSELFDELLEVLRERGDLSGTVAAIPDVHQKPAVAHSLDVQLVKRHIEPAQEWAARATYRVQEGATSGNQQLVTVAVGPDVDLDRRRVSLPDGAAMPAETSEKAVLDVVDRQAAVQLLQNLREAQEAEQRRQREAQEALVANLEKQLAAAEKAWRKRRDYQAYDEMEERQRQLNRAIAAARKPTPKIVDTELRAELLTLEMHGSDQLVVVERWEHTNGTARELRYPWTGNLGQHGLTCEATGKPLATLSLCGGGHVVDRSALSACQTCTTDWCGACGPTRAVQACRGCKRVSCATCRNGGPLCASCAQPQRAAELDTEWETGWRLGGDAYLLVGERHAVLVDGSGDRQTLVSAPDAQDPVRARLRGLAHRLGLPAGTGLVAAAPKVTPADLIAGSVWAKASPSTWWTWQPATGAAVDPGLVDELPDLTSPPVAIEDEVGFAALLAGLRRSQPAPQAPAVAAMPFAIVQRVDVRDGQFVYRELWHDGDRAPQLAREDGEPLQVSRHEVAPFCRSIAEAVVGPVRVEVDGLHRSYVCLLTDGTYSSTLFVPGLPGATVQAEGHLARTVAAVGLPTNRVVVRHPESAPSAAHLRYSTAATDVTVKRTVKSLRTLVEEATGDPETGFLFVDNTRGEFAAARLANDEALRLVLDGLAEPVAPVSVADCVTVDEQWQSPHGTATRQYLVAPAAPLNAHLRTGRILVAPGEPVAARLADGNPVDGRVYVDSGGHLVDEAQVAGCPVCAQAYGPCCGDDGTITGCWSCRRPACGSCRANDPSTVAETRCERCGDRSCGHCSRELPLRACQLCGRDVCKSCGPGPVCLTCQHLAPATPEQIRRLPVDLCAQGVAVLLGEDDGGIVAVLHSATRSEVAVVSASGPRRWETATGDDEDLLRVRLGAARLAGNGDVDLRAVPAETVPVPVDWLTLQRSQGVTFQWVVQTDGVRHAGNAPNLAALPGSRELDPDLAGAFSAALYGGAEVAVPTPVPAARRAAVRRAAAALTPPGRRTVATACRQHTELALALTPDGFIRRRAVGKEVFEERAGWQVPDQMPAWAFEGWQPGPEIIAATAMDGWTAVVAAVGEHIMLGLRQGGEKPVWHRISDDTELDLWRAALGLELLGERTLATVVAHTPVEQIQGPVVVRGRLLARQTWRVVNRQPFGQPGRMALFPTAAVAAIIPHARPSAPAGATILPEPVVRGLRARFAGRQVIDVDVTVGQAVEEQWSLPTGETMVVRYEIPAGQTLGYVRDAVTGAPLHQAAACRRHHLVESIALCSTCLTATCAACPDAVRPCVLCGGRLCGTCVGPDGRCPTCADLRKVGLFERGKFGVSLRGAAWHSTGRHVQVTVRRDKGRWSLERWDNDGRVVLELEGEALQSVARMLGESDKVQQPRTDS